MKIPASILAGIRKSFDLVLAGLDKVKLAGALGTAWAWFAWAVKGLVASIWAFLTSPAVWLASIVFFCVGWIAAFNLGQKLPERQAVRTVVDTSALKTCQAQRQQLQVEMGIAQRLMSEAEGKIAKLEAALAEKPKVIYRTRKAPAKPESGGIQLNWPNF